MKSLNPADVGLMDSVFSGYLNLLPRIGSNCGDLFIGKPAIPMVKPIVVSAFDRCIFVVVRFCAKAKVIRINALRIVANVHNNHSVRNFAIPFFVREAMRSNGFFSGQKNYPIPIGISSPHPKPTGVGFFDSCLENVIRRCFRIAIKCAGISSKIVMLSAKFSCDRFFSANNARKLFAVGNVTHINTPKVVSNRGIICLIHGGV